jgi:hypothetical protein
VNDRKSSFNGWLLWIKQGVGIAMGMKVVLLNNCDE